jgi:hypothetical protein
VRRPIGRGLVWTGGGRVYDSRGGGWRRILSWCIDDPEQGPVITLPAVVIR